MVVQDVTRIGGMLRQVVENRRGRIRAGGQDAGKVEKGRRIFVAIARPMRTEHETSANAVTPDARLASHQAWAVGSGAVMRPPPVR